MELNPMNAGNMLELISKKKLKSKFISQIQQIDIPKDQCIFTHIQLILMEKLIGKYTSPIDPV